MARKSVVLRLSNRISCSLLVRHLFNCDSYVDTSCIDLEADSDQANNDEFSLESVTVP